MVTLQSGVQVVVDAPPLPAVTSTTPADLIASVRTPTTSLELVAPAVVPVVVEQPSDSRLVVPVGGPAGPSGGSGPNGPPGPPGPVGNLDEDLPDLTLLFENGLI